MTTTWEQVLEIRRRYALPKEIRPTQWNLAEEYDISQTQVSLIVNNKICRVPGDVSPSPPDCPKADAIIDMYTSGTPVAEILNRLCVSGTTMYRVLRKAGIPLRNKKGGIAPIDHPQAEALADMYLSEVPIVTIQDDLHMNPTTMYRLLREMDIPLRNAQKRRRASDGA